MMELQSRAGKCIGHPNRDAVAGLTTCQECIDGEKKRRDELKAAGTTNKETGIRKTSDRARTAFESTSYSPAAYGQRPPKNKCFSGAGSKQRIRRRTCNRNVASSLS